MNNHFKSAAISAFVCLSLSARAQSVSVTYQHRESVFNIFMKMSTGGGALTPDLYFKTLHSAYYKEADEMGVDIMRELAIIGETRQVKRAQEIDSAFTAMKNPALTDAVDLKVNDAKILNIDKIERLRAQYDKYLTLMLAYDVPDAAKDRWTDIKACADYDLRVLDSCNMPNTERMKQYLIVQDTLQKACDDISAYLAGKRLHAHSAHATQVKPLRRSRDKTETVLNSAQNAWRTTVISATQK